MTGRALRPLEDVANLIGGGTPPRANGDYFGNGIPWVTPTDLPPIGTVGVLGDVAETITDAGLANSSAKVVPPGTVLFSSRASIGKIAVADRPCATNQGFCNFVPNPTLLDSWYLAYFLASATQEIVALAGETTFKEVSRKKLRSFQIPVPPLPEQQRVVARVRACMDRVEELRELRVATVEDAKRLEAAMFHDFILDGAAEKAWPTVELGELTESSRYGTSAKATPEPVGTPVLRMGNIVDGVLDYSDLKYMNLPRRDLEKYLLVPGDILINRTNSLELVGKAATFDRSDGDWVYASYLVCVRVDKTRAIPEYVTAVINSNIGRNYVLRTARRAIGMVNINAKEIARFPIPLPPVKEQREVVDRLAEVRSAARQIRESISVPDADQLVGAVLRKAFAGEL